LPKRRPTKQDAEILVQLWQIFPREAYRWFQGNFSAKTLEEHDKKYPPGSLERDYITQLREFYETVGVLVSQGVLSEDLFFDVAFHLSGVWEKLGPVIKDWQRAKNNPAIEENMEWLARRYESWLKTVWKPGLKWKTRNVGYDQVPRRRPKGKDSTRAIREARRERASEISR